MIHQDNLSVIAFCVDMNETENCSLKIEERQRNIKVESALILILMAYYSWFLGKHSF